MSVANHARPAAVYRLYDSSGKLLYIGSSVNPPFRWSVYAKTASWWPRVARKTLEWHDRAKQAQDAARKAIGSESPVHNPTPGMYSGCDKDRLWCAETRFGSTVAKKLVLHAHTLNDLYRLPLDHERLATALEASEVEIRSAIEGLTAAGHARINDWSYAKEGPTLELLTPSTLATEVDLAEDRAERAARAALRVKAPPRPSIPREVRSQVYERDGHACLRCGATKRLTLDHIHPWSKGGPDTMDNLQTLCGPCNSRKQDRLEGVADEVA